MGAAQFVKAIHISKRDPGGVPQRIEIDFTRHFANATVLTALHDSVAIYSERGKGLSWEFEIQWFLAESERDDSKPVYRLEFIPRLSSRPSRHFYHVSRFWPEFLRSRLP